MAPHPQQLLDISDFQQIFSDALASFSPLATLVGSDSARSLTHHVSNVKQSCAASLAPIGALGMMATVCKGVLVNLAVEFLTHHVLGANLHGVKDMLGAGEADITDACAELGCGALHGVVPRVSARGGLSSQLKDFNRGTAACAILRAKWRTGDEDGTTKLDFEKISLLLTKFESATVSGRLIWDFDDITSQMQTRSAVVALLRECWDGQGWRTNMFEAFNSSKEAQLKDGRGLVELHWPAPAMTLETNASIVLLFIFFFSVISVAVVVFATSPLLQWQSTPASVLLLGGQLLLASGHVAAQWIIKHQRHTVYIDIPRNGLSETWMLVDNTWFTSVLARRPVSYKALNPNHLYIGQHLSMKRKFIPTSHALLTLIAIGIGFIAFYVGARSSNVFTILIYIGLFFAANLLKGSVVSHANKAYVTPLNNPGYGNVVTPINRPKPIRWWHKFLRMQRNPKLDNEAETSRDRVENPPPKDIISGPESNKFENDAASESHISHRSSLNLSAPEAESGTIDASMVPLPVSHRDSSLNSVEPLSRHSHSITHSNAHEIPLPSSQTPSFVSSSIGGPKADHNEFTPGLRYRVYTKFALRHTYAIGMFYFSRPQAWGMAAHVIYEALHGRVLWQPHMHREQYLCLPFEFLDYGSGKNSPSNEDKDGIPISALMIMAIDETRHEDMFWSAGIEFVTIILGAFADTTYLCSEYEDATNVNLVGLYVYHVTRLILLASHNGGVDAHPGVVSMMRAIDLVRGKYPFDTSEFALRVLQAQSSHAVYSVLGNT
ncbi:hypothetical protein BDQ12DRAFT_722813 [Crucibulum laeve]|uniref:Uncharacterized protein n=1 Tax=Crucibulum laeve TaxID=68775 RepID=A0A5C3M193_9AGAR|nr:hypothetical protein BDQ12DRAFT_722813 [Crucibulum laeve]